MNDNHEYKVLYNTTAADGVGDAMYVKGRRHLILELGASGISGESCVVKIQASSQEDRPTFSSAASPTNSWAYIQVIDLEDGSAIDGTTGITVNADGLNRYEIQSNGATWVDIIISATSGTFTLFARLDAYNESKV